MTNNPHKLGFRTSISSQKNCNPYSLSFVCFDDHDINAVSKVGGIFVSGMNIPLHHVSILPSIKSMKFFLAWLYDICLGGCLKQ